MLLPILYSAALTMMTWHIAAGQIAKRNGSMPQPVGFQLGPTTSCCDHSDEQDAFLECLTSAAAQSKETVLGAAESTHGPTMTVGLITQMTEQTLASTFSLGIKQAFAESNGYFVDIFEPQGTGSAAWEKIQYMHNALDDVDGWARHVDFLVWIEDDLVVVDIGMRIEAIFSKYKRASMLISEGMHAEKIATSFLMLRNNARTLEFLEDWLRQGRGQEMSFDAATAFDQLIDGDTEEYEVLVKILPADALNTKYPAALNFKPHNQVLNLHEEHTMFKERVFSEGFHELCRVDASKKAGDDPVKVLPRQLDLNAKNLSNWGVSVYRSLFEQQLQEYADHSREGLNDAKVSGDLASSLRQLARLLEAADKSEAAQALREKAFKELFMNFKKRRPLNVAEKEKSGEFFPDWLEFMDHVTLVGSEYAQKISDTDEKRIAMKVMLELANELDTLDATRHSVQERLMTIHMDLGMISGTSNENEESTKHFVEAVRIGRILLSKKVITEADMFFPLSFCGDAFMKQTRYKEALIMYGYALDIGKKRLAAGDIMLHTMKLQYGIACYYDKRYRTAVTKIEEGLDYFARNEIEMDDETYAIVEQAVNVADAARKAKYDPKVFDDNLRNEF